MQESLDISQPKLVAHAHNHKQRITDICFKKPLSLFTSSLDGNCIAWNFNSAKPHVCFRAHNKPVVGVRYNASTNLTITCSTDKTVQLFHPNRTKFSPTPILHSDIVRGIDFHADTQELATISDDNAVKIWDLSTSKYKYQHMIALPFNCWFRSVQISPSGILVATAGQDGKIRIYDMRTRLPIQIFKDHTGVPRKICWHPDGFLLAAAFSNNRIRIYNICIGEPLQEYDVHGAPVNDIAFHPVGHFLVTACDDCTVKIMDLMLGQLLYSLIGHDTRVCTVRFDKDGDILASGDDNGHLLVWRANLDTYNRERIFIKDTNEETMAAGGELDEDKSIVIDQRLSEAYTNTDMQIENSQNVAKCRKIKREYMPPSRIPVRCDRKQRFEIDDY